MTDSQSSRDVQAPRLVTLDPPKPPPDIVQSALFLPLSSIRPDHKGRKIRTIGQILAYEPKAGILLLSAIPERAIGPLGTLLVDVSTPLLGRTPAMPEITPAEHLVYSREPTVSNSTGTRKDEPLKLERGEFVTIVGWLEGDGTKLASRVSAGGSYLPPMPVVLEAIHAANCPLPPSGALYRGTLDIDLTPS